MSKSEVENKKKRVRSSHLYYAMKSKNELYYQMASIFKEVSKDEDSFTKKIFSRVLQSPQSKIFMENSL